MSLHLVDLAKSLAEGADLAMAKMLAGDCPLEAETVQVLQDAARLSLN